MIAYLQGILLAKQPSEVLINVQGVGYEVQISLTTYCQLPDIDQAIALYTQLLVREDAHSLVGFSDRQERDLFRALVKVNGVGPKLALTILSSVNPQEFYQTLSSQDITRLSKIPGIGKKTAERLVIELRDKIPPSNEIPHSGGHSATLSAKEDSLTALMYLGYSAAEANRALAAVDDQDHLSSETLLKSALQHLAR